MTGLAERIWATAVTDSRVFVIVAWVVVVLAVFVILFGSGLLLHHAITQRRRRRRRVLHRRVSSVLGPKLTHPEEIGPAAREAVDRWGIAATSEVLRRARTELTGDVSREISRVLEELGETDRLLALSRSRQEWKRAQAIRELAECGGARAQERLIEATDDPDSRVRHAARDGLLIDHTPEGVEAAIHSYLRDAPSRSAWRRSFYARLATVASEELLQIIEAGQLSSRELKLALEALGDAGEPDARPFALDLISSEEPELRATAARVLGKLADRRDRADLLELLEDEAWYVRAAAARALGEMPTDPQVCGSLGNHLGDEAWWVRTNSGNALVQHGKTGKRTLLEALDSDDRFARHAALTSLAFADLDTDELQRLDERLKRLPSDGIDDTAVAFLRSNPALEQI